MGEELAVDPEVLGQIELDIQAGIDDATQTSLRHIEDLGVLAGLSKEQCWSLGIIVLDGCAYHSASDHLRQVDRLTRLDHKRSAGQVNKLRRKLQKARKALADLRDYGTSIGNRQTGEGNAFLAGGLRQSFLPYVEAAIEALDDNAGKDVARQQADGVTPDRALIARTFAEIRVPEPSTAEDVSRAPFDPQSLMAIRLYGFFVNGCCLRQNEAEVRIAKIGNKLWGWNIAFREQESANGSKGSDAVRKWVAGQRRSPDTPKITSQ